MMSKSQTPTIPRTGRHDLRFFVYMIESPSARDAFQDRSEQPLLSAALALSGIHCTTRTVLNLKTLETAFKKDFRRQFRRRNRPLKDAGLPLEMPIIHLSCHGDAEGIELSDGREVSWETLGQLLEPINAALKGNLILCLSACYGFAAKVLAQDEENRPFGVLVGHEGEPYWSDAAVGYSVFYHLLEKGVTARKAVEAMCTATADPEFKCKSAREIRREWQEQLLGADDEDD
jgi:hypothetical protein